MLMVLLDLATDVRTDARTHGRRYIRTDSQVGSLSYQIFLGMGSARVPSARRSSTNITLTFLDPNQFDTRTICCMIHCASGHREMEMSAVCIAFLSFRVHTSFLTYGVHQLVQYCPNVITAAAKRDGLPPCRLNVPLSNPRRAPEYDKRVRAYVRA